MFNQHNSRLPQMYIHRDISSYYNIFTQKRLLLACAANLLNLFLILLHLDFDLPPFWL